MKQAFRIEPTGDRFTGASGLTGETCLVNGGWPVSLPLIGGRAIAKDEPPTDKPDRKSPPPCKAGKADQPPQTRPTRTAQKAKGKRPARCADAAGAKALQQAGPQAGPQTTGHGGDRTARQNGKQTGGASAGQKVRQKVGQKAGQPGSKKAGDGPRLTAPGAAITLSQIGNH